jgi:hypothetical protein
MSLRRCLGLLSASCDVLHTSLEVLLLQYSWSLWETNVAKHESCHALPFTCSPDYLSLQTAWVPGARKAPAAAVIASVQQLLDLLQQRGYICGWQLVLGSLPGGWPADWSMSEQQLVGLEDLQQQEPLPVGLVFQVSLANGRSCVCQQQ